MKRYCLALDLKNDPKLIDEYERLHREVRPEIEKSIVDAGVLSMEIYRTGTRMFMIMEVDDDFSFERKASMDAANPKVVEWENFVWKYQHALPDSNPGEKWILMKNIFDLKKK